MTEEEIQETQFEEETFSEEHGSTLTSISFEKIEPHKTYLIGWAATYSVPGDKIIQGTIYELKEDKVLLKRGKKKHEVPYKGTTLDFVQKKKRFILDQQLRLKSKDENDVQNETILYPKDVENGELGYYPTSGLNKKDLETEDKKTSKKTSKTKTKPKSTTSKPSQKSTQATQREDSEEEGGGKGLRGKAVAPAKPTRTRKKKKQ